MHAGKTFSLFEAIVWTRRDIFRFFLIALVPVLCYELLNWTWLALPWLPIAMIGTAVAFLIGFKNNASYDRLWEARKIWGAIVNSSRSWGIMALDYVTNDHAEKALSQDQLHEIHQRLIYRHIAWLTALRFQLRTPRAWESMDKRSNREYAKLYPIVEKSNKLEEDLKAFLTTEELQYVLGKKNRATQIIRLQSKDLKALKQSGYIEDFRHMEMENMLVDFYTQQGKSERIKNFPYPRQYATINLYFVWLFILLVPFGMIHEFEKIGELFVWLTIPFTMLVAWVFHTMERIGESTENPFQGGANDIPVTALSRTIEIDLREMLDETELPPKIEVVNNILS